ncbi:type II secretion system protein GspE [Sphingorhabdus wooponensis]|uniref:Type II secretion system protein GspE n=2 Tax=Sphingorhabdus wooponensis TaxID=940136 RepID=A0A426RT23_9SPHN|nr:ATPase, T2SS/T4P/T4SS family [Sphingorhabdus wooponensis]RRQ52124.1 type II secretion system protein GspE [Sphingorhabdus wooponensis]
MVVAMREGADPLTLLRVLRYFAIPADVEIADSVTFDRYLSDQYAMDGSASAMVETITAGNSDLFSDMLPGADDLPHSANDTLVIRLIYGIIAEAVRQGASNIHVEPYETGLVVRTRTDGILKQCLRLPANIVPMIVRRIKVMARLDIAEHRIPQDGRIGLTLAGKLVDVHVSTLPSRAGERIVLCIVNEESANIPLELPGMSADTLRTLRDALSEPNGVILVTGPTGSGTTTTLYAGLKGLNDGTRNILTVEDPIEHPVEGIGQTEVSANLGVTFVNGLRAILLQDPDVVMVSEIRNSETARVAFQAALTGHLVLTTMHANDAVGAITGIRDMKVEPFLLASTLRAVIAQRLVRRLCSSCREIIQADGNAASLLGLDKGTAMYQAVGCGECDNTGFQGLIGVFEAVRVDATIRRLINDGGDEAILARHAFINKPNLSSAARKLVLAGYTTAQEAIRISRREDIANV